MTFQIYDTALPEREFKKIKTTMIGGNFPWHLNQKFTKSSHRFDEKYDLQLVHMFYARGIPLSKHFGLLKPLLSVLEPTAIMRIKANLTPVTPETIAFGFHTDVNFKKNQPPFKGETAIYYLNTNNGYTMFEDGTQVKSVENRLLIFDAQMLHAGTSCTDEKFRCLINLNYYTAYT